MAACVGGGFSSSMSRMWIFAFSSDAECMESFPSRLCWAAGHRMAARALLQGLQIVDATRRVGALPASQDEVCISSLPPQGVWWGIPPVPPAAEGWQGLLAIPGAAHQPGGVGRAAFCREA